MEFKGFFSEFSEFSKKRIKKLVLLGIITLYLIFLITYNFFRGFLSYSIQASWIFGLISALVTTFVLVLGVDVLIFYNKKKNQISYK